ncbi:hypothetical protein FPRO04_12450 [Fusarium proliferatum]|nr:hypothetical protein FPRO04_12450 [Fusarium proliferatum]
MPAPSAPRNSFAQPISPPLRPPTGAALPLLPQVLPAHLRALLEIENMGAQVHNLIYFRFSELIHEFNCLISWLKTAVPEHLPLCISKLFSYVLQKLEKVSEAMSYYVRYGEGFLIQRNQHNTQLNEMCQFVNTMRNQTPINLRPPQPERWEVTSSSDYEREQEDPKAAESSDRRSSFAPFSPTFGCTHMDPLDPSSGETLVSNSVPEENLKSEKTSLPPTGGHFATGEVQDDLSRWSKTQEEGSGYPDSMNPPGYARPSPCGSQPSAEDEDDIDDFFLLFDEADLL